MTHNPFVDPELVRNDLYRTTDRLDARLDALLAAKVQGRNPLDLVGSFLGSRLPRGSLVLDIGCGRGGAAAVVDELGLGTRIVCLDVSAAMVDAAIQRTPSAFGVQAPFEHVPLRAGEVDAVIGAFCLYHSPHPATVVRQLASSLGAGGLGCFLTKSADSYHEIDDLLRASGLLAGNAPSLYTTFSTENCRDVLEPAFRVIDLDVETHVFHFPRPNDLAAYVVTSPKYPCYGMAAAEIEHDLRGAWPAEGLRVTSEVAVALCEAVR